MPARIAPHTRAQLFIIELPDGNNIPNMKKTIVFLCTLLAGQAMAQNRPAADALFASKLTGLDNKPVALERYRGKALIVNFWARWCTPCRQEIPELIKFRQAHQGKIEVLGIGIEDKSEPVREFAARNKMDYPVLIAGDQGIPLMQALGNKVGGLPYTLYIDGQGHIAGAKTGMLKPADLEAAAALLLPVKTSGSAAQKAKTP